MWGGSTRLTCDVGQTYLAFDATNYFQAISGTTYIVAAGATKFQADVTNTQLFAGAGILFQIPTANGSSGNILSTNGAGVTSWIANSVGTVTSVTSANASATVATQTTTPVITIVSAPAVEISGQTGLLTFTGLAATNRVKTIRDAADTILELGGSYTPTGTWTNLKLTNAIIGGVTTTGVTGTGKVVLDTAPAIGSPVLTTPTITTSLLPTTDDACPLGSTTKQFSDLFLATGAVINYNNGNLLLTHSANTMTVTGSGATGNTIVLPAGGTALAPLRFISGTVLSTPAAGAMEYDGVASYITNETTSGRAFIPAVQYFRLSADTGTVGAAIANFFGATSNISLVSGGHYLIEIDAWYLKTTNGTVTWTFTNSANPTKMNLSYQLSPITGIVGTAAATTLFGDQEGLATAVSTFVTGSLTTGVLHHNVIKIFLINNTGTSLKLQVTSSAGTVTPQAGSFWRCTRMPANSTGAFAA